MELGSLFSKKYPPHFKWGGYFLQRAKIFILMTLPLRPHLFFYTLPPGEGQAGKDESFLKKCQRGQKAAPAGAGAREDQLRVYAPTRATVTVNSSPSRTTVRVRVSPTDRPAFRSLTSSTEWTLTPSTAVIRSPGRRPWA